MLLRDIKNSIALCGVLLACCSLYPAAESEHALTEGLVARLAYDGSDTELERKLWQVPGELNQLDARGLTPLQEAVCQQHASAVRILCSKPTIAINAYSNDGLTALHYAVAKGQCNCQPGAICPACQIITTILNVKGLSVDLPKYIRRGVMTYLWYTTFAAEGATALHIAALKGDERSVGYLIAKGAGVNKLTSRKESALHFAASQHDRKDATIQIIKTLCSNGAAVGGQDSLKYTPLHILINSQRDPLGDDTKIAQCLLDLGADINDSSCGLTPLIAAVNCNNLKMVRFLLHKGAQVNAKNSYGYTALDLAISKCSDYKDSEELGRISLEIKRTLLAYGACSTLSQKNKDIDFWMAKPAHAVASCGDVELLQDLIEHDDKHELLNSQTDDGSTPLHCAVMGGHAQAVRYLLLRGALYKKQSAQGTPEQLAVQLARPDIVTLLQRDNIAEIVAAHRQRSPQDMQESIDKPIETIAPRLPLRGHVVPALQQMRPDYSVTAYCGYYALYNALSFARPEEHQRLNREAFVSLFENALGEVREGRGHSPLDNLASAEIRQLINNHFQDLPIIVLEQNDLLLRASGLINTIDEACDHDVRTQKLLAKFLDGSLRQLVVIAGLGNASGHWMTLLFNRGVENTVSVTVADSLKQPEDWTDLSVQTAVLPFYLALTTAFAAWPSVLSPAMLHEIMPDFCMRDKTGNVQCNPLLGQLRDIMVYTHALDKSLENYLNPGGVRSVEIVDRLLIELQMTQLAKLSVSVLYMLSGYQLDLKDDDSQHPLLAEIQDQLIAIPEKIKQLETLNTEAKTTGNIFEDMVKVREYRDFFRKFRINAQKIIEQLQGTQTEVNLMPRLDQEIMNIALDNNPQVKNLLARMYEGRPVRVLLHGPAGTGKSTLACAIAKKIQDEDRAQGRPVRPIIFRNAALIKSSMQYCVEETFKKIIEPYVVSGKPAIVIIDELDSLGGNTKEEFLSQSKALNGLISADSQVSFIVTANDTKVIEDTLLSRFKRDQIKVDVPTLECRAQVLRYHLTHVDGFGLGPDVTDRELESIAKCMNGRSNRDVESLVEQILGIVIQNPRRVRTITLADIKHGLRNWVPTTGQKIGTFSRAAIARTGEFLGNNWQFFVQTGLSCVQHKANMEQSERHFQANEQSGLMKTLSCACDMAKSVVVQVAPALAIWVINKWSKGSSDGNTQSSGGDTQAPTQRPMPAAK